MKQPTRAAPSFAITDQWQLLLVLAVFGLIGLMAIGPALSGSDSPLSGEGSPARQAGYLIVTLMTLVASRPWLRIKSVLSVPMPIVVALAILLISLTWAIDSSVASRRLLLTAAVIWTLCTLTDQLGYRRMVEFFRVALALLLVANFVSVFLFPQFAIHQAGLVYDNNLAGDWRGMMVHKNTAGAMCAITVLFFLFDARAWPNAFRAAIIGGAVIFLYFSQSKTSLAMLVGTAAIGYLFQVTQFRYRIFAMTALAALLIGLAIYLNIYRYAFFQLATDPKTLTGRAIIWTELSNYSADHFWFGAGYGSFWAIGPASPIFQYSNDWVRDLAAGHNGYLDLACQIGVPLAAVVIGLMFVWPFARLIVSPRSAGPAGAVLISTLTFCAGHNMTETSLLERDMPVEVALVLTIALIWKLTSAPEGRGRLFGFDTPAGTRPAAAAPPRLRL